MDDCWKQPRTFARIFPRASLEHLASLLFSYAIGWSWLSRGEPWQMHDPNHFQMFQEISARKLCSFCSRKKKQQLETTGVEERCPYQLQKMGNAKGLDGRNWMSVWWHSMADMLTTVIATSSGPLIWFQSLVHVAVRDTRHILILQKWTAWFFLNKRKIHVRSRNLLHLPW